jgi:hypothetical protein
MAWTFDEENRLWVTLIAGRIVGSRDFLSVPGPGLKPVFGHGEHDERFEPK